jgi:hypothetical protein
MEFSSISTTLQSDLLLTSGITTPPGFPPTKMQAQALSQGLSFHLLVGKCIAS